MWTKDWNYLELTATFITLPIGFAKQKSSSIWGILLRKIESGRDMLRKALRLVGRQDCTQTTLSRKEMTIRAAVQCSHE